LQCSRSAITLVAVVQKSDLFLNAYVIARIVLAQLSGKHLGNSNLVLTLRVSRSVYVHPVQETTGPKPRHQGGIMSDRATDFTGSIPQFYDHGLGPVFFLISPTILLGGQRHRLRCVF